MDTVSNRSMENFTNVAIDTAALPRFEDVGLTKLHPNYYKVILLNTAITFVILGALGVGGVLLIDELRDYWWVVALAWVVLLAFSLLVSTISFRNRGFAFRTHDALYKSGAISISTTIIPYTRVQHVALNEGLIARWFGLAAIEIFTAGGKQSDIEIKGLEKEHAEKIKQLLMGKILERDTDEQ